VDALADVHDLADATIGGERRERIRLYSLEALLSRE
jgi:hypothetical protein